jgi:hypothetical protein
MAESAVAQRIDSDRMKAGSGHGQRISDRGYLSMERPTVNHRTIDRGFQLWNRAQVT